MSLLKSYQDIRKRSVEICKPLKTEDYVVQPIVDVSPPKWHLGHTTWFFETFILKPFAFEYQEFDPDFNYVFNSYYETVGARVIRTNRGNLSRPGVDEVYRYRKYVDEAMVKFLEEVNLTEAQKEVMILGFNHEQQHQELLITDIKYILGHNPLFPAYSQSKLIPVLSFETQDLEDENQEIQHPEFISFKEGVYEIGFSGEGFCFDNELNRHKVYVYDFSICNLLVSNKEYLEFIDSGAYQDFRFWHADGLEWVKTNQIEAPMYWHKIDSEWYNYTLSGLQLIQAENPVCHISYYEAAAYASWKKMRLPTEAEWEIAARNLNWGKRWEWTESAYLPYPGFKKAEGAIGEYNGKFMINQMVLRGASEATSPEHSRITYRNFFQPDLRWQFTGIRLAK
ncbi:ergothioneine biosynthesis protein EgtB [Daejeonella oryzae]|uniref:ergothioneine biosynthesis protein EgtB n=1 Tax=Daejeonella oryzae TaxID=1122943 RepID=UPI0003F99064|nr:ergothioneine biosynthesis protein EgtB [Daejeonella oryzae]